MRSYDNTPQVPSGASCNSLDMSKILSEMNVDSILTTSLTFSSTTDSSQSLSQIPSFPSTSRPLFVNLTATCTLINGSASDRTKDQAQHAVVTVPTSPRMKAILMEPIAVSRWAESLPTQSIVQPEPWQTGAAKDEMPRSPWIPSGSLFSPELFRAMFRTRREPRSESWTMVVAEEANRRNNARSGHAYQLEREGQRPPPVIIEEQKSPLEENLGPLDGSETDFNEGTVPTIMLSNSTAAVRLSLESNHSLVPPPIAVRRGRTGPPALPLSTLPPQSSGLYPGIPTAFLGSPSTYTPKFEFSDDSGDCTMDLEAMCHDLRSRCPPLTPVSPIMSTELGYLSDVAIEMNSDSEEWDFARELLDSHLQPPVHTPMRPAAGLTATAADTPLSPSVQGESDSVSWSTDQTLTNSPQSGDQSGCDLEDTKDSLIKPNCAELPKQQRRRTVIIETPRNSVVGAARPVRMTVDLSHLADPDDSGSPHLVDEIPFEKKDGPLSPTTPVAESTPYSRPISSASMGRPVRSILKNREKKSVRFSELPSTHEYSSDVRELESVCESDEREFGVKPRGRKRAATTPASSKSPSKSDSEDLKRASFPKHPNLRSLVRSSPAASECATPTPSSSDTKGGRQSLLVLRSVDKKDVGRPKRLTGRPVARASLPVNSKESKDLRKQRSVDENRWRRSAAVDNNKTPTRPTSVQRSRMPFKSILTKLRS